MRTIFSVGGYDSLERTDIRLFALLVGNCGLKGTDFGKLYF